jgi:rubrerythrin
MRTAEDDLGEELFGEPSVRLGASRRAFLRGAGLTGVTLTAGAATLALPALVTSAAAQTTTTAPPKKPQAGDLTLLAFLQSVELAAVTVYGLATTKIKDETVAKVAAIFAQHHKEHAAALGAIAAKAAPGTANAALVKAFTENLNSAKDQNGTLKIAFDLENAAAATYAAALGTIVGTDPAALMASILPIESKHAVVLGQALGLDLATYAPTIQATDAALTTSSYPIEG